MTNHIAEETIEERTCELEFIYRLCAIIESAETFDALLRTVVGFLPSVWQPSKSISCVIRWEEIEYKSGSNRVEEGGGSACFHFSGERGIIRIFYSEPCSGILTQEKEKLLRVIANQLGYAAERFNARQTIATQQRQLVRADKLVAMGTLAAGVAHEINNPTCFIMLNAPMLKDMWDPVAEILEQYCQDNQQPQIGKFDSKVLLKAFPTLLAGIHKGARRIKHIVREMKEFVREDDQSMETPVDMNRVLCSAEALLHNKLKSTTRHYHSDCSDSLPVVKGNFQRLEQVVINLIMNACEALTDEGQRVEVQTYFDMNRDVVCLSVKDEGSGIPQDDFRHIFDPFFTTKRNIGGTGLGLAISNNIVAEHHGELKYQSTVGEGTCVVLRLPVYFDPERRRK